MFFWSRAPCSDFIILLVKGYPAFFCTIGKHDWPQLSQLQTILMTGTNWWQGLWEQLSSFCLFRLLSSGWASLGRAEGGADAGQGWGTPANARVCICTFVCMDGCWVPSRADLYSPLCQSCRCLCAPSIVSRLFFPGKCFQLELGYRKAAQTSKRRQECPSPSKDSVSSFLYLQLKREQ